jgi:hypothetical protein
MPAHLEVPYIVYQAERKGMQGITPHKHSNSAREASAFLMFIAEYYDCLPEVPPLPVSPPFYPVRVQRDHSPLPYLHAFLSWKCSLFRVFKRSKRYLAPDRLSSTMAF